MHVCIPEVSCLLVGSKQRIVTMSTKKKTDTGTDTCYYLSGDESGHMKWHKIEMKTQMDTSTRT